MRHSSLSERHIELIGLVLMLMAVYLIQTSNTVVNAQTGTVVSAVPQTSTPQVGKTVTVNLTISNVQNLYALDVTLDWNTSILQFVSVNLLLGVKAHPGGVLFGNQISNSVTPGDIYLQQSDASQLPGEYHLVATSVSPADSFNGSGIIATITFKVANSGYSALKLQSELADLPAPGETTSNPIEHQDSSGALDASAIPEFPSVIVAALVLVGVTAGVLFSKRVWKKRTTELGSLVNMPLNLNKEVGSVNCYMFRQNRLSLMLLEPTN